MITINKRLQKVSEFIKGEYMADIGSDHAYLPIYAVSNKLISKAIAGEVIKGPFEASEQNVNVHQLNDVISVKLGDGLSVLPENNDIDTITICGMGGPLIAKILAEGRNKLTNYPRLILQSNIQSYPIRLWLEQFGYTITNEEILEEKKHIYEIIVADKLNYDMVLTEQERKFGPQLIQNKNKYFIKKWTRELQALKTIAQQLDASTHQSRLKEVEQEIILIKEVLGHEN
ncbi:tRNA (adenine(22)-N(1))-methyltransferase [Staphylococcus durrellii]|uniref:tRNA (adenine(22)-N(1))-methyltransferase n=1 Tax=Staphylococcus durrellii TaxID=2781773 RepID=UPI00189FE92C|nr:tRNA (adenine(22)-N(1))-methyltransferase TrmK [Staphylococcus durrellii]MBF7017004.1 tRNA (adenine(22)-N(1))-methyltransferase TrmK [Staphylococcus durrellii]